jgi:hypothetical protein
MTSAGRAFRVKRQTADGETIHAPTYNACRACHKPIDGKALYCSPEHEAAHKRLAACR